MQLLNSFLRWDANGANEEGGLLLNNHIDELWELALGVVVLVVYGQALA